MGNGRFTKRPFETGCSKFGRYKFEMMVNGNQRFWGDVIRDIQQNVDSEP